MSFSCVSHSANVVAHSLARFARSVEDEVVWLEDIPPPALQALYEDSNSIEIKIRSAFKKKKKKKLAIEGHVRCIEIHSISQKNKTH